MVVVREEGGLGVELVFDNDDDDENFDDMSSEMPSEREYRKHGRFVR